MFRAQGLLVDRNGALVERLGLRVAALLVIQDRQEIRTGGHGDVLIPESGLSHAQRLLLNRNRLGVLPLFVKLERLRVQIVPASLLLCERKCARKCEENARSHPKSKAG